MNVRHGDNQFVIDGTVKTATYSYEHGAITELEIATLNTANTGFDYFELRFANINPNVGADFWLQAAHLYDPNMKDPLRTTTSDGFVHDVLMFLRGRPVRVYGKLSIASLGSATTGPIKLIPGTIELKEEAI